MKILSIAEDNLYNLWQLELQIYHFKKLGLSEYFIPIVVGKKENPTTLVKNISENKQKITYYPYEDLSVFADRKYYPPSLQSYGVYKFLEQNPLLKRYLILDVDCLFQHEKNFYDLFSLPNEGIYSSPAEYNRIDFYSKISPAHAAVYDEIFEYLGFEKDMILEFEKTFVDKKTNPAGHTIFFNQFNKDIFKKITKDSKYIHELIRAKPSPVKDDMSWMGSIWSYYYNIIAFSNTKFESTPLLDFCWATDSALCNKPILHMTGTMRDNKEKLFCKMDFLDKSPLNPEYYEKVNFYSTKSISYIYTNLIREYWNFDPIAI